MLTSVLAAQAATAVTDVEVADIEKPVVTTVVTPVVTPSQATVSQPAESLTTESHTTESLTAMTQQVEAPSASGSITSVFLALVFVILAIAICAWLAKRLQGMGGIPGRHMKVLSVMPLSHRERIMLVDVAGQQLLLGVSPGGINTLHTFDEPVINENEQANTGEFADKLKQFLQKSSVPSAQANAVSDNLSRSETNKPT